MCEREGKRQREEDRVKLKGQTEEMGGLMDGGEEHGRAKMSGRREETDRTFKNNTRSDESLNISAGKSGDQSKIQGKKSQGARRGGGGGGGGRADAAEKIPQPLLLPVGIKVTQMWTTQPLPPQSHPDYLVIPLVWRLRNHLKVMPDKFWHSRTADQRKKEKKQNMTNTKRCIQ